MLFTALALSTIFQAPAAPAPGSKALLGPPCPWKLVASETVWVFGTYLPVPKVQEQRSPFTPLGAFQARLRARPSLRPLGAVDPLGFLPSVRYGGNPIPGSYTIGAPLR